MTGVAWLIAAAAVGLAAGIGGARWMLARARRGRVRIDFPDPRRLHRVPTPRGGGIGIIVAGLLAVPLALPVAERAEPGMLVVLVLAWGLPLGALGVVDDHRELAPRFKLAVQLVAATVAAALGLRVPELALPPLGTIALGPLALPFSVLWLVWMANVFNFMDGMDALAAECGALFAAGLAALAVSGGAPALGALALAVGGALLGFLRYNAPPARIFMGDGGSLFTGAVLGGLGLALARTDVAGVPPVVTALLLGSFVFDATFTVVRRALRGQALRPHRTHFYQRLALAGWPHHRVRALYVGLSAGGVAAAFGFWHASAAVQAAILLAAAVALGAVVVVTRRCEREARRFGG